jgi:bisanhydrobacterioruberin hydratase
VNSVQKTSFATWLAMAMHLTGVIGIQIGLNELFHQLTPFNLLAMFLLVWFTAPIKNLKLLVFFVVCFAVGYGSEQIGVHTGLLFGNYSYGEALGPKWMDVPLMIGVNWFIVVYAAGMLALQVRQWVARAFPMAGKAAFSRWLGFSLVLDGALLATMFDWIMEPAAVRLGFWQWDGGHIPMLNYISWFLISMILLFLFRKLKLQFHPFAVNLLLIQALFFLLVRG